MSGSYGHWSAVLNYDSDNEAEIAMIGGGQLALYEHDGTLIHKVAAGTGQPGPPCVADFDGDDFPEIAWPSSSSFNVYELDGTGPSRAPPGTSTTSRSPTSTPTAACAKPDPSWVKCQRVLRPRPAVDDSATADSRSTSPSTALALL
ncbi:MAG: VCBS repeat-containing protein [Deltaproteobacteria bacterium]|nr:VCBS repeat-containing protein [Deltaproteobacteria bacterium]